MKKIFTFFLLFPAFFGLKSFAQTNGDCNARFDVAISNFSVKFTPAITSDALINHNYWNFGDGTISSEISPAHLYLSAGTYTVKHYFYKGQNTGTALCVDSVEKRVEIKYATIACDLHVKFSFERDASQSNKVYFHNLSTPATNVHVKWMFGDGTISKDFNATHVYTASGLYNVCLIVQKDNSCQRDTCAKIQIQIPSLCNLEGNFEWHADALQFNKIQFVNTSLHFERTDTIRWTFGDGTSSFDGSPTHTYSSPGTYNVCIRVKKKSEAGSASCVKEICKQVAVANECRLQADFNYESDGANKNKFYFKPVTTSFSTETKVKWNFGDGALSNEIHPDHIYAHAGIYHVCLTISSGSFCVKEICKNIEIKEQGIDCHEISKFNFSRSAGNCLEFKFEPVTKNSAWQYHWTFGDGTFSNDVMPSHLYSHADHYNVCLMVKRSALCASTYCRMAETGICANNCNNSTVKFVYSYESAMPNRMFFHAKSNTTILSQRWTITKTASSPVSRVIINQNDPIYFFTEPGYYTVCLRAVTAGECVKEYCEQIYIQKVPDLCHLETHPNPAHTQIAINLPLTRSSIIHLYIYNSLNVLVKQKEQQGDMGNNVVNVNIENLVAGQYTLKIISGDRICYARFQKL